jgi:hypothetical protein
MINAAPLRFHFNPTGAVLDSALDCEAEVFLAHYGNTEEQLLAEYGQYDSASVFMALANHDNHVIAASRLIVPGPAGLKTLNDTSRAPWSVDGYRSARAAGIDVARTWDVATIAVRSGIGARRLFASAALYHGLVLSARMNDIRAIIMTVDERVRSLLTGSGLITSALPGTGPAPYLGSTSSTPVYAHCAAMLDTQRRINPEGARLIADGVGLDGIAVPDNTAFRITAMHPMKTGRRVLERA